MQFFEDQRHTTGAIPDAAPRPARRTKDLELVVEGGGAMSIDQPRLRYVLRARRQNHRGQLYIEHPPVYLFSHSPFP